MSIKVKDADSVDIYLKGTGVGSVGDPFVTDPGLVQPLTDTELRATPVPISGALTDAQIRATALLVSGTFYPATQPVSIASPVAITDNSGSLTMDSVLISVATAISGQITGTFAGTEQQGANVPLTNGVYIKALAGNTGVVYVGNDGAGTVSASSGFQLDKGDMILIQVSNLNQLWFDVVTSCDKFCWLKA